ncbi:hypothetical protein C8R44DRAFT_947242 [Mycena epipterygia]|nr:hypothetical protein C8R44DRAFT_947242 [Mycena epipterygia]
MRTPYCYPSRTWVNKWWRNQIASGGRKKKPIHLPASQQRLDSNKYLGGKVPFRLKETPRPSSKPARARRQSPGSRNAHTEKRAQRETHAEPRLGRGFRVELGAERAPAKNASVANIQQHLDSNEDLGVLRFRSPVKGNPGCTIHHTAFMVSFRTWRNGPGMKCPRKAFRKCTEKNYLESELSISPEMTEQRRRTKKNWRKPETWRAAPRLEQGPRGGDIEMAKRIPVLAENKRIHRKVVTWQKTSLDAPPGRTEAQREREGNEPACVPVPVRDSRLAEFMQRN